MAITFNPITKQILIPAAEANPLEVDTLRDAIRAYEASVEGIIYEPIIDAEGLTNLGGSTSTFLTIQLLNNWQVAFSGTGIATINGGNLVGGLSDNPFASAPGVTVINQLSQAGVVVETGVSGLTSTESEKLNKLDTIEPNTNLIPYLVAKP